jgi:hypothetical protein
MALLSVSHNPNHNPNPKFGEKLRTFNTLLDELKSRDLPLKTQDYINSQLISFNAKNISNPKLHKSICKLQTRILRHLEKELKIVPKGHYQQQWMALGMASFGITLGASLGMALGNMAYIAIGLPLGMVIGMGVGSRLDKKAADEKRQLQFKPGLTW